MPRTFVDNTTTEVFDSSRSFKDLYAFFENAQDDVNKNIFKDFLQASRSSNYDTTAFEESVTPANAGANGLTTPQLLSAIRTCNSYFFPQPFVQESDVARLFEGMAAARAEREDFIITPDLRGNVSPLLTGMGVWVLGCGGCVVAYYLFIFW